MPEPVYLVLGNHGSQGIGEIVYALYSCLSEDFSVTLTQTVKPNCVNVIIDEFSGLVGRIFPNRIKERWPGTRLVIIATEFVTPVSLLGVTSTKSFNFFGTFRDWCVIGLGAIRQWLGGRAPYMQLRYRGFVRALPHCDILGVVHPKILSSVSDLLSQPDRRSPPAFTIYPQIGSLCGLQEKRLRDLPVGFIMTGKLTSFRKRVKRDLERVFKRAGWSGPVCSALSFESGVGIGAPLLETQTERPLGLEDWRAYYGAISPTCLFNLNPPQSAKWPYSSPMRIVRSIMLGQIPVITRRFHDHPLEDVALDWDGKVGTAIAFRAWQSLERSQRLGDYVSAIAAYDRWARQANAPFVEAIKALTAGRQPGVASSSAGSSEPSL